MSSPYIFRFPQSRGGPLILVLVSLLGGCSGLHAAGPAKPNILFILSDDQTWEALGVTGGEVKTPNLDRLAARGMLFTSGYNMGSWTGAVCVASRTMFNTGRSLWHCRDLEQALLAYKEKVKEGEKLGPRPDMGTIWSQWIKAAGYRTYFAGKWHTAIHEAKASFDVVGTIRPGMARDTPDGYNRPDADGVRTWLPWDKSKGGHWEGGKHWAEVLADEGVGLLGQVAQRNEPFFMYLAFNSPHDPRQSPKEYIDLYPIDSIKVPRNFLPDYPYRKEIGLPDSQRDERLAPHPRTEFAIKVHRQEYYALVTFLDAQVGRILDALDKSGKADNTFIFFSRPSRPPGQTEHVRAQFARPGDRCRTRDRCRTPHRRAHLYPRYCPDDARPRWSPDARRNGIFQPASPATRRYAKGPRPDLRRLFRISTRRHHRGLEAYPLPGTQGLPAFQPDRRSRRDARLGGRSRASRAHG